MNDLEQTGNYERIERAIVFLESNFLRQPSLDEIAASAGLSKYHFQRLFKNFAGITPTQFLHFLTVEYAKTRLSEAQSVFLSAIHSGVSGGGRLHDMFINVVAMTPGEYKNHGEGVVIYYGIHQTPFGDSFIALTKRGVISLQFLTDQMSAAEWVQNLKSEWPKAVFEKCPSVTHKMIRGIFSKRSQSKKITLVVRGTNFQIKVWQALLNIPEGALVSYQNVATKIGARQATRAVASAIANNPVAYLIPCHRVISKSGKINQYRWGENRKKAMIAYEAVS